MEGLSWLYAGSTILYGGICLAFFSMLNRTNKVAAIVSWSMIAYSIVGIILTTVVFKIAALYVLIAIGLPVLLLLIVVIEFLLTFKDV